MIVDKYIKDVKKPLRSYWYFDVVLPQDVLSSILYEGNFHWDSFYAFLLNSVKIGDLTQDYLWDHSWIWECKNIIHKLMESKVPPNKNVFHSAIDNNDVDVVEYCLKFGVTIKNLPIEFSFNRFKIRDSRIYYYLAHEKAIITNWAEILKYPLMSDVLLFLKYNRKNRENLIKTMLELKTGSEYLPLLKEYSESRSEKISYEQYSEFI